MAEKISTLDMLKRHAEECILNGVRPSLAILGRDFYAALTKELRVDPEEPIGSVKLVIFERHYDIAIMEYIMKGVIAVWGREAIPESERQVSKVGTPFFIELREGYANPIAMQLNKLKFKTLYPVTSEVINMEKNLYQLKISGCEYRFNQFEIIGHPHIGVN